MSENLKVLLSGAGGTMGRQVMDIAEKTDGIEIVAGLGTTKKEINGIKVYDSVGAIREAYNAVLDFSKPEALDGVLSAAHAQGAPLVIATTGYSPELQKKIEGEAKKLAILKSSNFSVNVLRWVKTCAAIASQFKDNPEVDIEIVEAHHKHKTDGPSGTAKTVAEAILKARGWGQIVTRSSGTASHKTGDIGISFIRGGNISGFHEVWFCTPSGEIKISEREYGRESFAAGSLEACKLMNGKKPIGRIYTFEGLLDNVGL
jgi:4-hydroxy-tetrahydrodipicolinate reductase